MNPVRRIATWVLKHRQLNAITDQEIFELIDFGIAELNKVSSVSISPHSNSIVFSLISPLQFQVPTLIQVPAPTQVYGDLHGQLTEIIEYV
jgi:hypothetical protein